MDGQLTSFDVAAFSARWFSNTGNNERTRKPSGNKNYVQSMGKTGMTGKPLQHGRTGVVAGE